MDFVITHEGPLTICNELLHKHMMAHKDPNYDLPKFLEEVKNKTKFKHWFFAHYHFGPETYQEKFTQLYESVIALEE